MSASVTLDRRWYRNLVLVTGFVLIALGLGNWVTGTVRLREHADEIAALEASDAGSRDGRARVDAGSRDGRAAVNAELEVARNRMDFYHVVASGGRLMTAAGIVLAAFGVARRLRGEARRVSKRSATTGHTP
ncbi:MAG TPA: hypothetical protein VFD92_05700 [Candidatus Binatia bacterium]|nr:hypothetical protein [Candidatus Binatia bacterium]